MVLIIRSGQGRRRCTSTRDNRFIVSNVLSNCFLTSTEARARINIVAARIPRIFVQLASQYYRAWLTFERKYVVWTVGWKVCFTRYIGNNRLPRKLHNGLGNFSYEVHTDLVMLDKRSVTLKNTWKKFFKAMSYLSHHPLVTSLDSCMTAHVAIPQDPSLSTLMRPGFKFCNGRHVVLSLTQLNTFETASKECTNKNIGSYDLRRAQDSRRRGVA